jgi:hypothetical protein
MMQVIKWRDNNGTWQDLPVSDIAHMPVAHAVALFSRNIPVIIKEGAQYLVNTPELLASYKKKGSRVMMIGDVDPSRFNKSLSSSGFVS